MCTCVYSSQIKHISTLPGQIGSAQTMCVPEQCRWKWCHLSLSGSQRYSCDPRNYTWLCIIALSTPLNTQTVNLTINCEIYKHFRCVSGLHKMHHSDCLSEQRLQITEWELWEAKLEGQDNGLSMDSFWLCLWSKMLSNVLPLHTGSFSKAHAHFFCVQTHTEIHTHIHIQMFYFCFWIHSIDRISIQVKIMHRVF